MSEYFHITTDADGVRVIELRLPSHVDEQDFDRLSSGLLEVVRDAPSGAWILDLSGARYVGSALLGLFVNVRQIVRQNQGALVLCSLSERLLDIIEVTSMQRLFIICRTRTEARQRIEEWG